MLIRRGGPTSDRFAVAKTALFFLAAGIWIAGVLIDDRTVTAVAIGVLVLALVLRLAGRGGAAGRAEPEDGDPGADVR